MNPTLRGIIYGLTVFAVCALCIILTVHLTSCSVPAPKKAPRPAAVRLPQQGPPLPPGVTNGTPGTNVLWAGLTTEHFGPTAFVMDTTNIVTTNIFGFVYTNSEPIFWDTNHYYFILGSADLVHWSLLTNLIGGQPFSLTLTNQNYNFRAKESGLIIWGSVVNAVGREDCAGPYQGYARFSKPVVWGWAPSRPLPTFTDPTYNMTKAQYLGAFGDNDCGDLTITVHTNYSPVYQFAIYYPTNCPPTGAKVPGLLEGFQP